MAIVRTFTGDVIAAAVQSAQSGIPTVLFHICNDRGGWGAGFTGQLTAWWPEPERHFRATRFQLGQVQPVHVQSNLVVMNACAQRGYSKPGEPAFRLEAFRLCLQRAVSMFPDYDFYFPRVGAGLGRGNWYEIAAVLEQELISVPFAAVYSLSR